MTREQAEELVFDLIELCVAYERAPGLSRNIREQYHAKRDEVIVALTSALQDGE